MTDLARLLIVIIPLLSLLTAASVHAQLMPEPSIEEQLMNALRLTSGNVTQTQTETTNATQSELARAIAQVVDASPSCNILFNTCVNIVYESPSKVVLTGDFITPLSRTHNDLIWQIVDMLETKGFNTDSINLTGQGSKGNPHSYLIVMSK
ncbi:MAG: hypothetical protein ACRD47_09055 [Nitrososphaeraceae archaeon]